MRLRSSAVVVALCALSPSACQRMRHQPKFRPLDPSPFFSDGRSARPLVPDTVPTSASLDEELVTGRSGSTFSAEYPFPVDRAALARGRLLFERHCAVCHDRTGMGNGIVVQNGFPRPPAYTDDTVMAAPPGFYVLVIYKGFGKMGPYGSRVPKPEDRWAIAAYIQALQFAGRAEAKKLPSRDRSILEALR